jgi:SCY1-like protein 1
MKVLPELVKSVEFGGGGPRVFSVIMKISSKLSEDEYEQQLVPVIVRLFASQDRAMRVCLLDNLSLMIDHLPQKLVSNSIFPHLVRQMSFLVVIFGLLSRLVGYWLLRYGSDCPRADCQSRAHGGA